MKEKVNKTTKKILSTCIFILLCYSFTVGTGFVYANGGDVLSAWAFTVPDVTDGILSLGEWDDADSASFTLELDGESHDCIIYVKNDADDLYLAVKINDVDYNDDDILLIGFDNDNDGDFDEEGNDGLYATPGSGIYDDYRGPNGEPWYIEDTLDSGSNDVNGGITHTNPHYVWEVSHPIDTNDDDHDFSLKPGDTVGFFVYFYDWDVWDCDYWQGKIQIYLEWSGRTIGFWKTNIGKQIGEIDGKGIQVPIEDIENALLQIQNDYPWGWIPADTLQAWYLLNYMNSIGEQAASSPDIKAQAQTLALLLTVEIFDGTTDPNLIEINDYGSDTVSGWINQIVAEFDEVPPDYEFIQTVADFLNNFNE